jgi:type I restriction enzyme S subunit
MHNNGWKKIELSDPLISKFIMGQSPPSASYNTEGKGLPFYQGKKEFGELYPSPEVYCSEPNKIAEKGDILLSVRAPVGPTNICPATSCIGRGLAAIRPNTKNISTSFLLYFFKYFEVELASMGQGSTFDAISKKVLDELLIPVPPLPEQRRIVDKLDSLFVRTDKAIAIVEQNITNTQHLMASILNDVFEGLDCDRMKLQDACIINPPKSEVKNTGNLEVSFLPMADLNAHQIDFISKHTKRIAEVYTGYTYFKNGDVLLAKVTPCFENGKAGLAHNLVNGIGFGSSEYYVLRSKQAVLPAYVYFNLTSSEFLRQGAQNMSGTVGLKRVTKDFLFNYEIPVPSVDVQKNVVKYFANQTTKLSELTSRLEERLTELKALKSSLLDSAFKGELL